ncbi:UNVERIFIED_CONTAM: membrane AbrB-like protein [Brevibacillus sp. OAP136]
MLIRVGKALLIAVVGGTICSLVHSPLPWLLGPLIMSVVCKFFGMKEVSVPAWFRKVGLIVVGVTLGMRITPEIWQTMANHLGLMLIGTIITILFGVLNAWIVYRFEKVDVVTAIFSNIPGGLTEMVTIGQTMGGNLQIISMFHSIRVVIIVCFTPYFVRLLTASSSGVPTGIQGGAVVGILTTLGLLSIGAIGALLVSKARIPAPFLLGSLLFAAAACLAFSIGDGGATLAKPVVNFAQAAIGLSIGLEFRRDDLVKHRRFFFLGMAHSLLLFVLSLTLAFVLPYVSDIELIASVLGTAPGGIAEMSLTALMTGADPLLVTAFQLFRVLFIVTVFSFLIRAFVKRIEAKSPGTIEKTYPA